MNRMRDEGYAASGLLPRLMQIRYKTKKEMIIHTEIYHSPCGDLLLGACEEKLCLCDWTSEKHRPKTDNKLRKLLNAEFVDTPSEITQRAAYELEEYFAGRRRTFSIPLLFAGTDFQKKVWSALLDVPFGETKSYAWLAKKIGNPKAVRAVGLANGANNISIFAPCHRIIGSNGSLVGYGGGLEIKRFLLNLENK